MRVEIEKLVDRIKDPCDLDVSYPRKKQKYPGISLHQVGIRPRNSPDTPSVTRMFLHTGKILYHNAVKISAAPDCADDPGPRDAHLPRRLQPALDQLGGAEHQA